jgi:hypothetical protein
MPSRRHAQGCRGTRDRSSRSGPFDAATELSIQRVRRSRASFIFPHADRKSTSIGFGFIAVGVHTGGLSSNFLGRQAWAVLLRLRLF